MAGHYKPKAHSLLRRPDDTGYRIGWRHKYRFERGHFDEEMTYAEAEQRAAELAAKEPDKTFFPEMVMEPHFER